MANRKPPAGVLRPMSTPMSTLRPRPISTPRLRSTPTLTSTLATTPRATRRGVIASGAALAAAGALAACGPARGSQPAGQLSSGPVRLSYTFWSTESNRQMQERNTQLFAQKHPNISFEILHNPSNYYEKLQTMFAADTPPDVFDLASDQFPAWVARNTMLDLTALIKRDQGRDLDMKDIWPKTIKHYEWQGKQYGIPRSTSTYAIYYNVEHFRRAGIPLPDGNWTWDGFLDTARKLTRPDGSQWGYFYHAWQHWMWSGGGEIMVESREGKWRSALADAKTIAAFQFLVDLRFRHKVMPVSTQDTGGMNNQASFMAGKVSMYDEVVARTADHRREKLSFEWDVAPLPKHPSGSRATFERPSCRAVAPQSKFREEAWAFVKFVTTSKESQEQEARTGQWIVPSMRVSNSPAFLDPGQPPKNMKVFLDALSDARVNPVHAKWEEINRMLGQEFRDMFGGTRTVREALTVADQKLTAMLKEWGDHA